MQANKPTYAKGFNNKFLKENANADLKIGFTIAGTEPSAHVLPARGNCAAILLILSLFYWGLS